MTGNSLSSQVCCDRVLFYSVIVTTRRPIMLLKKMFKLFNNMFIFLKDICLGYIKVKRDHCFLLVNSVAIPGIIEASREQPLEEYSSDNGYTLKCLQGILGERPVQLLYGGTSVATFTLTAGPLLSGFNGKLAFMFEDNKHTMKIANKLNNWSIYNLPEESCGGNKMYNLYRGTETSTAGSNWKDNVFKVSFG